MLLRHGLMIDAYNGAVHDDIFVTINTRIDGSNHYWVIEERNIITENMIAKIYPLGHPDLQGKRDPSHPVRYFDIRKLTPFECFRLMGVPEHRIEVLLSKDENGQQIISNSSLYKLAGNSIVCDVLLYIYESLIYPVSRRISGEPIDMFARPQFTLSLSQEHPFRIVTLCSGYDSQCLAAEMLAERHPDFSFELMAWSEFDPESKRELERQPAVVAHNLLFPQWADRNRGDMTKADWSDLADADIDLLTYSTPCQSISQAGKREGIKRGSGTRSAVLWSTENAVSQMRPKVLLQENVRALIDQVNMPDFKEWCDVLVKHGYVNFLAPEFPKPWGVGGKHSTSGILNAKDYGVPQNRERVYMVSIREDVLGDAQYEFPRPFPLDKCIADMLQDDVSVDFFLQPDSVIKFLQANEEDKQAEIYYAYTDHKLSDEEIEQFRANKQAEKERLEERRRELLLLIPAEYRSCYQCRHFCRSMGVGMYAYYDCDIHGSFNCDQNEHHPDTTAKTCPDYFAKEDCVKCEFKTRCTNECKTQ